MTTNNTLAKGVGSGDFLVVVLVEVITAVGVMLGSDVTEVLPVQ